MAGRRKTSAPRRKSSKKIKLINIAATLLVLLITVIAAGAMKNADIGGAATSSGEEIMGKIPEIIDDFTDQTANTKVTDKAYPCEVRFIDVGQGDSSLILSDGYAILIDGGENDKGKAVVDYLNKLKIKKLDMIIASHPHSDHIGGLDTVMNAFPVDRVIMPKLKSEIVPTTKTFEDFLDAIEKQKIKPEYAEPKKEYTFGKGVITVFAPIKDYDDLNNSSIGLKFVYDKKASFLFTGDMEKTAEKELLKSAAPETLKADVFKSPHHGSNTSSSADFFKAVNPKYCVISCGTGNSYHHPHPSTLKTYDKSDAATYRTDIDGDIIFGYDENGYHVEV